MKKMRWVLMVVFLLDIALVEAQQPTGTIKGTVTNAQTKEPLAGVNVSLLNTQMGAATDENGEFHIINVPVGNYNAVFHYIGFEKLTKPDGIVRSGRITFLNAELSESMLEMEAVTVKASYFQKSEEAPLSVFNFNAEEIRRAPGSAGDISRILMALPSAAQVYDNANDLMVRGGSPFENGFFVDNIPIPNINHFPVQGATGGPIGIINVDFIEDVNFHTGGFSAAYGDRLSSIIDIKFREGNRDELDLQIDGNMGGFGGIAEGPLPKDKGAWYISGKRSYLELLVDAIGTGVAPRYGDIQGKISYDLNPQNKITVLNIFGASSIETTEKDARENGESAYGKYDASQNTFGLNWRSLWSKKGYSNTSISYAFIGSRNSWNDVKAGTQDYNSDNFEGAYSVRNINFYQFSKTRKMEFGVEAKREIADYDYFFAADTNRLGELVPALRIKDDFHVTKAGAFASLIWNPVLSVTTTFGLRADYFSYNDNFHLSPRISTSWQINERMSLNGALGVFYQNLPLFILSQEAGNKRIFTA
jgi:hypothetical protein